MPMQIRELYRSPLSGLLFRAYGVSRLRRYCRALAARLEGGEFRSATLRRIFRHYHNVEVGAYSYGCFFSMCLPGGTHVGRYVSIAGGVRILPRNHPMSWLSTHPYFFNDSLGWIKKSPIPFTHLTIEDDAWVGADSIVTPSCKRIGVGAVVGAGSVVTHDVPDFAIVAGNPARLLRYRFPEEIRKAVLAGHWWLRPVEECAHDFRVMTSPLTDAPGHPFLVWDTPAILEANAPQSADATGSKGAR